MTFRSIQPPARSSAARRNGASLRAPALTIVPFAANDPGRPARGEDDWAGVLGAVAQRQDREAYGRLFGHFAPRIKHYLMQGGSPEAQAEELAQEALVAVWRKAALFDPGQAAVSTWIFTIARNLRVDLLRRRRGADSSQEAIDADMFVADEPTADERLHAARLGERLGVALARLPPEQRQVLRLSYFDDEPHSRIAAQLGIPLGTVKSRLRLALVQLRRLLEC